MTQRAFVIAHFDPKGKVRADLLELVQKLTAVSGQIVFVSTNLSPEFKVKLEKLCSVIVRLNEGYDFFSYKVGLDSLTNLKDFEEVVILNSSFLCLDPEKLFKGFLDFPRKKNQIFGITKSLEHTEHLQSYFVAFPREVVGSSPFREWWAAMVPLSKREDVIREYELGMSTFFLRHGFTLGALFEFNQQERQNAEKLYKKTYREQPDESVLNPTQFNWKSLLEQFGIIKIELIAKNPHGINLSELLKSCSVSHRAYIDEIRIAPGFKGVLRQLRRQVQRSLKAKIK